MKNKIKMILIVIIIMVLCLSVGAYARYALSAKDVTYTKADGTTVTVKEALDELRARDTTGAAPTITIAEAQSDSMLTNTVSATVLDKSGNRKRKQYSSNKSKSRAICKHNME